jgi:dolichyl-diphosphooligosaccharide--protein glycosyltransferase
MVTTRSQTARPMPVPQSKVSASQARDASSSGSTGGASPLRWALRAALVLFALYSAYQIRLFAIQNYGLVIHEFDPWFNYRATVYLRDHGVEAFFKWYDHKVWYPLGRPVGTTIYPGMQLTSVAIWNALGADDAVMSLNDVCCYVPAWFGVLATAFLGLLAYECTGSADAGAVASLLMAIVPAHIMRSVGGGYDNESIAMTAMCATFYFWARSLRGNAAAAKKLREFDADAANPDKKSKKGGAAAAARTRAQLLAECSDSGSWVFGAVTGLAYIYMVAAWGGYIFVLNMIAFHAVALVAMGRYTPKLHKAYTLFYVIGTYGAIQVPVVGLTPLKSMEQLGALGVFGIIQLMWIASIIRDMKDPAHKWDEKQVLTLRAGVFGAAAVASVVVVMILAPMGYFGPLSSRVRGLFVQHTRTGNPLVDSVAEHQPASAGAYFQYLHFLFYMYPIGMGLCYTKPPATRGDSKLFVVLYGIIAYYFSSKMVRLVLLMGPIGSIFGGITLANGIEWGVSMGQLLLKEGVEGPVAEEPDKKKKVDTAAKPKSKKAAKKAKRGQTNELDKIMEPITEFLASPQGHVSRKFGGVILLAFFAMQFSAFWRYSQRMAENMSQPSIMFKARLRDGSTIIVDDYREAYWWLRDNTPEDSRVMAWWDYGYQINGIAERTSIADGNTWNHEHIATLGRALTSPEKRAHKEMVRHLADYVLVWAGGGGDDLAKSPHMARIGNSVYSDICPGDPTCRRFGFNKDGTPTPMMAASLLYRLHSHNLKPGVRVDPDLFEHVFNSKYGKVRIFRVKRVSRASKKWVADPANRVCDAPGSWYCVGQYPPALDKTMAKKKSFAQLEDWNKERTAEDDAYQEEYMARMSGRGATPAKKKNKKRTAAQRKADSEAMKAKRKEEKKREEEADKQDELEAIADEEAYQRSLGNVYEDNENEADQNGEDEGEADYEDEADLEDPNDPANWRDSDDTTRMWNLISSNRNKELKEWLDEEPDVAHIRSSDGKGPLFWAYEYGNKKLVRLLKKRGVDFKSKDASGHKAKFYKKKKEE